MQHTYTISGMTCNGCRTRVTQVLKAVEGVTEAEIDLEKGKAVITFSKHLTVKALQEALAAAGGHYHIHTDTENTSKHQHKPAAIPQKHQKGQRYYCPMQCEGDITYPKPGSCPVCGMALVAIQTNNTGEDATYKDLLRKFRIALVFTLPIFGIAMSEMLPGKPLFTLLEPHYWNSAQLLLSIPVVFYATFMFFERAWRSLVTRRLNMFTLIGIGAGAAWVFSVAALLFPAMFPEAFKTETGTVYLYFEATTVILTLVLLGQLLEAGAHRKTGSAITALMQLAPDTAIRLSGGKEETIPINAIAAGDILRIKPGGKIPVDGYITQGESAVDESTITGEPLPVDKKTGDAVHSGSLNGNGTFLMQAEKVGSNTLLSRIITMVAEAGRSRAPMQQLADTVSGYFVPAVIAVAVLTFLIWMFFGPEPSLAYAFVNAIAVLIIACPCALGLATPMSVMVGVGKGALSGILIKNAEALEQLHTIDILLIDKTGTITEGKPSVEKVVSVSDRFTEDEILMYSFALSHTSEHPLAGAIVSHARQKNMKLLPVTEFKAIAGKGVTGTTGKQYLSLGNISLMNAMNVTVDDAPEAAIAEYQQQGKTVSVLAVEDTLAGFVVLHDAIKETSAEAIRKLREDEVEVIMLTGDNENTAKAVAEQLPLSGYNAGCLPQDKLNSITQWQSMGKKVAMTGDGINDAPALAKADVGIAMGTGTDIAMESAGITLVKGDLNGIVKARKLSRKVVKNIRQNLFFALIYNTVGIPIAAGVLFPVFGLLLSPMIAALAMSFSSVSVIANALRLRTVSIV